MIVSFDLDETLFVDPAKIRTEPEMRFPHSVLFPDRLRAGAVSLLQWINSSGIDLWVYTTSNRSVWYIRQYFRYYGVRIDSVVNAVRHEREVQRGRSEPMPAKYPARYRIDLHVDDEISVYQNGIAHGFRVFLMQGEDAQWTEKLRCEIERIRNLKEQP